MRRNNSSGKRLFLEQLEDRCLLSSPDPAIAYTDSHTVKGKGVLDLVVMNSDGTNKTVIWSGAQNINQKSWAPDLDPTTPGYQGGLAVEMCTSGACFRLWVWDISVTGTGFTVSGPRTLLSSPAYNPAWSPRGDLIAFDGSDGIYVVPAAGGTPVRVVTPEANENWSGTSEPTWNPDATQIAFKRAFKLASGELSNRILVTQQVIDPATGQIIVDGPRVTVISEQAGFTVISDPDWSRLGDRIAFQGSGTNLSDGIYQVEAKPSGSFSAVPSTSGDQSPTWSPDDPTTAADESDRFLLYSERLKKTDGLSLVRQDLTAGTETVVVAGSKSATLFLPDWRRFPIQFVSGSALIAAQAGNQNTSWPVSNSQQVLGLTTAVSVKQLLVSFDEGTTVDQAQLARVRDAIGGLNDVLGPFGVTLVEVGGASGPGADIQIHAASTSPCGGAADGVLACAAGTQELSIIDGWTSYTGADPAGIAPDQYDFQTIVTHELLHALGFEHSDDPGSVMYATLAPGVARRSLTAHDLALPGTDDGAVQPGIQSVREMGREDAPTLVVVVDEVLAPTYPSPAAEPVLDDHRAVTGLARDSGESQTSIAPAAPLARIDDNVLYDRGEYELISGLDASWESSLTPELLTDLAFVLR